MPHGSSWSWGWGPTWSDDMAGHGEEETSEKGKENNDELKGINIG